MKIADIRAYPLKTRTALVRVFTDDGVEGIGECSPMNVPVMCHFVQTVLRPLVLGKNPLDVERLWDAMYFGTYKLGTEGTQPSAISGVDIALWDIKAKAAGMPLYRLLGGAVRTTFTMYKSIGGGGDMTPAQMLAEVRKAHEQGFRAVKIRTARVHATQLRRNNGYSVSTAIRQGRKLEELGVYHFEEPVSPTNYAGIRAVADALDVPVSAGEHEYTRWQFRNLILDARPDLLQPDVVKCCGITEMKRIAALAETFDMPVLPHQTQPSIGNAASLALCATLPLSTRPQEFTGPRPDLDELFKEPLEFKHGEITLRDCPGLGLEIDEKALAKAVIS
jgi:L-alanine-DL-glutamate epimerase-like enolase superfamily enzyme